MRRPATPVELSCGGQPMTTDLATEAAALTAESDIVLGQTLRRHRHRARSAVHQGRARCAHRRRKRTNHQGTHCAAGVGLRDAAMNVLTLLEMAATSMPGRVGVGRLKPAAAAPAGLTYPALFDRARCGAAPGARHRRSRGTAIRPRGPRRGATRMGAKPAAWLQDARAGRHPRRAAANLHRKVLRRELLADLLGTERAATL